MQRHTWMKWSGCLTGLAVGLLSVGTVWAFEPPEGPAWPMQVEMPGGEPVKLSEYWIGLECYPAPEAIRAQLTLPEGQGLAVASVVPDGPAARAGIKPHDILLKADDKPLGKIQELIDAVDAAKDKSLKLELLRNGKAKTIQVTPTKRPGPPRAEPGMPGADWDQMRKWIERMRPGEEGRLPMRFRFFHPGMILPPGAVTQPPLPENMSIMLSKEGKEPVKIVVTKGDQKWELNENELDKLPADVRPHVERMLGRGLQDWGGRFQFFDFVPDRGPEMPTPEADDSPASPEQALPAAPLESRVEKRIQSLERRLDQMRKSIDEMRENRPRLRERPEKDKPAAEKVPQEKV